MKPYKHVKVVKVNLEREFHTKQGKHMKNAGKEKVALKIAQAVTISLQEQIRELISLYCKTNHEDKGSQAPREEKTIIQEDLKVTVLDKKEVTSSVIIHRKLADEIKGTSVDMTQSGNIENLDNSSAQVVRASKRLKKPPTTKKDAFMVKENCSTYSNSLSIFHPNISGLRKKADELMISLFPKLPHILCLLEHHLKQTRTD
jgi:hypothetical protein